ncbi:MAG TPA: ATP synthase F0 subunit B [Candidatus Eisenbacteria bacterium]|nr:ATP synthase F0 subunit B [Candidatus Eisenbacteria bacterium]
MTVLELVLIAQALASEAGDHHAPSLHDIWFPLINFLIFAYLIKRFALPRARDYLASRRAALVRAMDEAAERERRAAALVQDYKARLARIDGETESIVSALRADGEKEKAKLVREARALADKIQQDARFLADQELKVARQRMREEIAETAERQARELIERHISAADQARLAEEFIARIGQVR